MQVNRASGIATWTLFRKLLIESCHVETAVALARCPLFMVTRVTKRAPWICFRWI